MRALSMTEKVAIVAGFQAIRWPARGQPHWVFAFGREKGGTFSCTVRQRIRDEHGKAIAPETYAVALGRVRAPHDPFGSRPALARRSSSGKDLHDDRLGHSGRPAQRPPQRRDFTHKVITTSEYLARPRLFDVRPAQARAPGAAPMPISPRGTMPRYSRKHAATGSFPPSKPCWSCGRPSSTSTRCRSSKTSSTAVRGALISN